MGGPVAYAKPGRERLPDTRQSITRRFRIRTPDGEIRLYVIVGAYDDGRPGELFISTGKSGDMVRGSLDAAALAVSVGLQHGVPLEAYLSKFIGMRFEPSGFTGDKVYPTCVSALDLIARWLRDKFKTQGEEAL